MEDLLYHYTNHDGLIGILRSKSIWATKIHFFNDYKEFKHSIETSNIILSDKREMNPPPILQSLYEVIEKKLESIRRINIFVSSLTERGDLLSQWRGYCPGGSGYSMGFSKDRLKVLAMKQGFTLAACTYDQGEQHDLLSNIIDKAEQEVLPSIEASQDIQKAVIDSALNRYGDNFIKIAPLIKHYTFSEEREWRLFSRPIRTTDPRWNVRSGRSTLIPYVNIDLKEDDGRIPLKNVYVGPGTNRQLAMDALSSYMVNQSGKGWGTTQSLIPYHTI